MAGLYERAVGGSFYDRMTPQQRATLDEGIAQAERGQVRPAEEVFDRLTKRFGLSLEARAFLFPLTCPPSGNCPIRRSLLSMTRLTLRMPCGLCLAR